MTIKDTIQNWFSKDANPAIQKASFQAPVLASSYRQEDNGFWMFNNDGSDYWYTFKDNTSALQAYTECPPVFSIVNKIAQAYINGKTWVLDPDMKESESKDALKLKKLLSKPNPIQTWKQFEAQCDIYISLFGYCVLLPIKPVGYPNIDATSIWNIPPNLLEIEESSGPFYTNEKPIKKITFLCGNSRFNIDPDFVYILKDTTPSLSSPVLPQSRLKSQEMNINNIIGTLESQNVLVNRRGALGILSSDMKDESGTIALKPGEKEAVQNEFKQYGLRSSQTQVIITNAALKWQQMGVSPRELMLTEGIESATMSLCDTFNYPFRLLAGNSANSLGGSDADYFNKQLYQNCIIPRAKSTYEQWNMFFGLSELNLILDKDYSHVAALQEDKANSAKALLTLNQAMTVLWQNNLITANEWLVETGRDPKGPEYDKYYYEFIKAGKTFGNTIPQNQITNNG